MSIWSTGGSVQTCFFFPVCFYFFLPMFSFKHLIEERQRSHSQASYNTIGKLFLHLKGLLLTYVVSSSGQLALD